MAENGVSRRDFLKTSGASALTASVVTACAPALSTAQTPQQYDAIVIGTGFGGTVAAMRLREKGKKVLLLERGTWWVTPEALGKPPQNAPKPVPAWAKEQNPPHPVQYWARPDNKDGLVDLYAAIRRPDNGGGLYQYSMFRQAHVVTASGVGGGSLIYSNVTLRPDPAVLASLGLNLGDAEFAAAKAWMETSRGKLHQVVTKIPLPGRDVSNLGADDYLYLDRSRVLKEAAVAVSQKVGMPMPWAPLDLSVVEYDPDPNSDAAKAHTFCERQGRCFLGCLPQARHTLNKTLYKFMLSDPQSGVTLMPRTEVRHVKRVAGGYEVTLRDHLADGREKVVKAPMVFLAAGTLGSTEILLRSRDMHLLPLGQKLGSRFSTNGDFGGFVLGTAKPVYSARGPINTCHVQVRMADGSRITIEDCAIPAMFGSVTSTALSVLDNFARREAFRARMLLSWSSNTAPDFRDFFPHLPDTTDPTNFATEAERVANIFFFNVMGQDDASGQFRLSHDELDLDWPRPIATHPVFGKIENLLKTFAEAMGGKYVPFPLWQGLADHKLIVTHPLGGCPIGPTNADGVVNAFGQVFDGSKPSGSTDTLPGLYVVDGSVIPGALAANPTMTIAAQALKAVRAALP